MSGPFYNALTRDTTGQPQCKHDTKTLIRIRAADAVASWELKCVDCDVCLQTSGSDTTMEIARDESSTADVFTFRRSEHERRKDSGHGLVTLDPTR